MPQLVYTGTITQNIFSNASFQGNKAVVFNSIMTTPITWAVKTNSTLIGSTLQTLAQNPLFKNIVYNAGITITGSQYYDDSSYPTTDVLLQFMPPTIPLLINKSYSAPSPGSLGTGQYNVSDTFSIPSYPGGISLHVYNKCHSGLAGCAQYSATNYTFVFNLNITLTVDCTGQNLNNDFCSQYCTVNSDKCISDYVGYCLPSDGITPPITSSKPCQDFIANYIQNSGPMSQIDNSLNNYCQSKYAGFGDLFSSTSLLDQNLCACHMPQKQYQNFEAQLEQTYPNFGNLGVVAQCMVPNCASSPYKSVITTGKCNLPQCLNITDFNNNGTFDHSNVVINQNSKCANLVGSSPSPAPTPSSTPSLTPSSTPSSTPIKSFWDKYKIIIISLIVLILLAIIIGIIFAARSSKSEV